MRSMMRQDWVRELKFVPPDRAPWFLWRPRLAQALVRGLDGRLILLEAPQGYGKSTLLASMAWEWERYVGDSSDSHLAWYRLEVADDDASVFVEGLVMAVRRLLPGFGSLTLGALHASLDARGRMDQLMGVFLDELSGLGSGRLFLVLDDFHNLSDKTIIDALERALQAADSPLRLIVSTQAAPRFYLGSLRQRGEVAELGPEDLAFTSEEMIDLVRQMAGRAVPRDLVDQIVRETRGWPSATVLASLLISRGEGPEPAGRLAPTEHGYGLLARQLLHTLSPELRDAALRASLLPAMDPDSCREGAGLENSEGFLQAIEQAGLPLSRPEGSEWPLCYDPLFRSALRSELGSRLLSHEHNSLRRKVASYCASQGAWNEAVYGYLEAEAEEEATALVERVADAELELGHLDTVLRWIRALPGRCRQSHPRLIVHEARLLLARERVDEARAHLVAVRPQLEASGDLDGSVQRLGVWAAVQLLDGQHRESQQSALDALEQLSEGREAERADLLWLLGRGREVTGDLAAAHTAALEGLLAAEESRRWPLVIRAMLQVARLAQMRGRFHESLALSGRAVQRSALQGTEMHSLSVAGGMAASIHLDRGQLEEAASIALRTLEASRRVRDETAAVRAGLALSRARELLGHAETARDVLDDACVLAEKLPPRRPERILAWQTAAAFLYRHGRRREGMDRARAALRSAEALSHRPLMDQCRLTLLAGELMGVWLLGPLLRTRRLRDSFERSDSKQWQAAAARLVAEGCRRLRLPWLGRGSLRKSLALAAEESCVGLPFGLPVDGTRLLFLAAREGIALDVAAALLGVDPVRAREALRPLLNHKDSRRRDRAERSLKGVHSGTGKLPSPGLLWPGLEEVLSSAPPHQGELGGKASPFAAAGVTSGGPPREDPGAEISPPGMGLHALGEFHPVARGQPREWPSVDALNLAAYLLVNRSRSLPRSRVLSDLWPGVAEAEANPRLHVALYRLRESLGPAYPPVDLRLENDGLYRWSGSGCVSDAELFRQRIGRAQRLLEAERGPVLSEKLAELLESSVALYDGEFMASIDFDWCGSAREDLRLQLLWASRLLIDHHMATHGWDEAISHGLRALRSDPLREDVVRDLMVCYFQIGDRDAVLWQYRRVKQLLALQKGQWPSDETRRLRVSLLGR